MAPPFPCAGHGRGAQGARVRAVQGPRGGRADMGLLPAREVSGRGPRVEVAWGRRAGISRWHEAAYGRLHARPWVCMSAQAFASVVVVGAAICQPRHAIKRLADVKTPNPGTRTLRGLCTRSWLRRASWRTSPYCWKTRWGLGVCHERVWMFACVCVCAGAGVPYARARVVRVGCVEACGLWCAAHVCVWYGLQAATFRLGSDFTQTAPPLLTTGRARRGGARRAAVCDPARGVQLWRVWRQPQDRRGARGRAGAVQAGPV